MQIRIHRSRPFLRFFILRFVGTYALLLSCGIISSAQDTDTVLKQGTDTTLIKNLIDAAAQKPDLDSALQLYNEPLQLSIAGNYIQGILTTYRSIARVYLKRSDFTRCILTLKKALPFCKKPTQKALLLHSIGNAYSQQGDFVKASENLYAALSELQNDHSNDPAAVNIYIDIYTSLAILNSDLKHSNNELYYLTKAEELARKEKATYQLTSILINKGTYYQERKKRDTAMIVLQECQQISKDHNLRERQADIDEVMGTICLDSGLYRRAIGYFREAMALSDSAVYDRRNYMQIFSSYAIADALYRLGDYKEAEATIVPALKKANSLDIKESITDAYTTLANIYKATGQYKKAVDCLDSFIVQKESLTGIEKTAAIRQIEIKYKTAEKDRQLSQNQLMIAQQNNKIARKNIWMLSIGGTLVLLILVSAGVYLNTLNKQRSLEKENKIQVLKAAVTGGDSERSRIARELHDGIGGMLSAAMMRFSSMHHENPAITHTAAYKDAMGILHEMGDEIRKTAHNLMPEILLKQSLPEAVRVFCNNAQEEGALKVDFQSFGAFDNLPQTYKLNVYRIIQELIKNATIHSMANHVLVQFLQNEGKLIVSVEDNGVGFNMNEVKGGMGLHNIRTRVSSMDGLFTLESEPGKGTTVIIELDTPESGKESQKSG